MINIRVAKEEDAKLVFELTKECFSDYAQSPTFKTTPSLLEDYEDVKMDIINKEVLIAWLDGKAVGSLRYYPLEDGEYGLIRLGVLKEYRSLNIGSTLLKEVEKRVRTNDGKSITLYSPYELKNLLNFYQNLGYKIEEVSQDDDYDRAKLTKQLRINS
ncbi:GNAT family N-acetyltransferase [Halonatronum saccharophilum]|uniref:GNAT family N-acetyltransferase n=1 Tax=Halonatronum saccharophilum TaxID=150060 RepID=UPI000480EA87|nr:GNAT family N-acetyltransferase [Halonatronum saccharophilum]